MEGRKETKEGRKEDGRQSGRWGGIKGNYIRR